MKLVVSKANLRTHKVTNYPIVLAPGLFGFDYKIVSYFLGVARYMRSMGCQVKALNTEMARVERRAELLKVQILDYLRATRAKKVNIIAHSKGGLDARYMISCLGMEDKVASLSTIATPHHGTSIADWGTRRLTLVAQLLKGLLGMDPQTFFDLTTESCMRFNKRAKNAKEVRYFTYSGAKEKSRITPLLWPSFDFIQKEEGANDGLVSVDSARWGEPGVKYMGNFSADHLNLVGWRLDLELLCDFDTREFYRGIVENLKRNEL
ncbi:MAG: hypothetical protein Q6354_02770 [Candidatus Brocadiales bacterium]|nr:hypothetical protein [Candidatus Brocadiales bacterium]